MVRRRNQQETTTTMSCISRLLLVLLLLELVSLLPAASCEDDDMLDFSFWLSSLPAAGADDVATASGCAKKHKDPVLCSAQVNTVTNSIDPDTSANPEDGSYRSIGQSIANIPDGSTKRYILILKGGTVYREKVFLSKSKPFVTIRSDDPINPAVIIWNDTAATPGKDGKPIGVDGSSTVTVESDYFIAYGVVFRNDAPVPKAGGGSEAPACSPPLLYSTINRNKFSLLNYPICPHVLPLSYIAPLSKVVCIINFFFYVSNCGCLDPT
ncbi:pectinesterase 1-like [Miscanthus floridulus]|uniref:pectinesterase 1-like n=1 Tax=Miscanthus floridulus TaxID=154761 RepID=UPI00345AD93C